MGEVGIIGEIVLRKIGKLQNGEDVLKWIANWGMIHDRI
jgi:hypothetical protein